MPEFEMVGADICTHDSEKQFFGAETRILCPSTWKEYWPACAVAVTISSAAIASSFFMCVSLERPVNSLETLGATEPPFRDLRHTAKRPAFSTRNRPFPDQAADDFRAGVDFLFGPGRKAEEQALARRPHR